MKQFSFALAVVWSLTISCFAQTENDSVGAPNIGERLFLDTRFSQFFFTNSGGNANYSLNAGDPVMNTTASIYGALPGPFAGQAMNCRACHLVEEHEDAGNRTYADFARRSPIPDIGDGRRQTPRNAMELVDSLLPHATPLFLHNDGQFATAQDLVVGTFTGRNFGWEPGEYAAALANIAHVIRNDDGTGELAGQYGGWSYAQAFAGLEQIESQYRIARQFRLYDVTVTNTADPNYVSDDLIVQGVAALVNLTWKPWCFPRTPADSLTAPPYDVFLIKNGLPRQPDLNETPVQYSQRLLQLLNHLSSPQFVSDPGDGHFITRTQAFQFGPAELAGLKIFFTLPKPPPPGGPQPLGGNCVACHSPPAFSDFLFHNTGASQEEYDSIHGVGAFMGLIVPSLAARQTNYNAWLPPTPAHPNATGVFVTPPSLQAPGAADLGLWNVFANPDFPGPQPGLQQIVPLLLGAPPPRIAEASVSGGALVFTAAHGAPGWACRVLMSTNLLWPATNWSVVSTNIFDAAGSFRFTNAVTPGTAVFYLLEPRGPPPEVALPLTIGMMKTANVRDLGSSDPYLHTGRMNTIEDVIAFYQNFSGLARGGAVRNAAPELNGIFLNDSATAPLAAFLRALNEDYFDIPCPCQ